MYSENVIRVRVKGYLEQHGITPYRLAKTMQEINAGKPSAAAVYAIVKGKSTPSLETVNVMLNALSKLRGESVPLSAVLEHHPDVLEATP